MTRPLLYAVAGCLIFVISVYAIIVRRDLILRVVASNVMAAGVFLFFVAMASRTPSSDPDPVPHAMVLTGIVVSVSATALGLVLVRRIHDVTGGARLPEDET